MNPGFLRLNHGEEYQDRCPPQNTRFKRWQLSYQNKESARGVIGFVQAETYLTIRDRRYALEPGMYFAVSGQMSVGGGCGIILECEAYRPQFSIGGPIEAIGRLKYIDGCTDSLLLSPMKLGDPCFNALYFPPSINQTSHTHPSLRAGLVVSGRGECVTPAQTIPLEPDTAFVIETNGVHCFRTFSDQGMVVVAYHPESDFGPTDQAHPMILRTIVDGVPASEIPSIQTK